MKEFVTLIEDLLEQRRRLREDYDPTTLANDPDYREDVEHLETIKRYLQIWLEEFVDERIDRKLKGLE